MKRPVRHDDGMYHMDGKKFKSLFGSRQQVWNGTVFKTPGGLQRNDLIMNKRRRFVSKKKYETAKREHRQKKRLFAKYTAKKGKFGAIKLDVGKSRKRRGGGVSDMASQVNDSPSVVKGGCGGPAGPVPANA